ncbi:photosystem II reaction center protein Psb28 [Euhalothece natronophila Z-M001]|uniref:Photosystem II reaction center Psb28 protein n=1 Tax=Euhalothece natronophila Z-M001 TaxID=522448 RepID=A0A5B8NPA1_9CHRO|nr:photosystem II reaction center protein Psb28 [Euhalothece natronophila]QDZ40019.1 photosystem II reaction center protein Psb28 [Euhalothece natronophila Z-M001]
MSEAVPTIEFFEGLPEQVSDVRLRKEKSTGMRNVLMIFEELEAIERFNSFRQKFSKAMNLTDSEGTISVEPDSLRFIYGGPEGDELQRVECSFVIEQEDHWERFMRFMERYAEANEMAYQDKGK